MDAYDVNMPELERLRESNKQLWELVKGMSETCVEMSKSTCELRGWNAALKKQIWELTGVMPPLDTLDEWSDEDVAKEIDDMAK